jgi:HEAT repeat protein
VSARVLLDEFRAAPDAELDLKWQLADRISRVATPEDYDEITEIAADPRHGTARQMLVAMLWRVKTKRARAVLLRSVTDDGVCLHAMSALRRLLGNDAARGIVEPLAEHPSERVRRAARAQLRKIANAGR